MKYCTKCGAVCADDTAFCVECGSPLPGTKTTQNYTQNNLPPNDFGTSYSYNNMQGQNGGSYNYNNPQGQNTGSYSYNSSQGQNTNSYSYSSSQEQNGGSYNYSNPQGQSGSYNSNSGFQPQHPYIAPRGIAMCIILSFVTCGIYSIYWMIKMNDEINSLTGDTAAASGGMVFLLSLVTCGIYSFYWLYKMGEKCDRLKGMNSNSNILYVLLALFGLSIVSYCLMQDTINKVV